jgi:hypothetical protein
MMIRTPLEDIQDRLSSHFEKVDLRGDGASSFIYATHRGRAVELSEDNGSYWVEFWECTEDEDSPPAKELTISSATEAIEAAIDWLRSRV